MPDTARAPEPVPVRTPPLQQPAQPALPESMQRAIDARARPQPVPEPEHVDPAAAIIAPLLEMPKWEAEHTFKLSTPVTRLDGRGVITEVKLRAPSGLDLFEVGALPTKTRWQPDGMTIDMDMPILKKWLARLAVEVDLPTFYRIPAKDLRSVYEWLNGELNQAGN